MISNQMFNQVEFRLRGVGVSKVASTPLTTLGLTECSWGVGNAGLAAHISVQGTGLDFGNHTQGADLAFASPKAYRMGSPPRERVPV